MKERAFLLFCFILIVIGFLVMLIFNKLVGIRKVPISELKEDMNYVKITGKVNSKYTSKSGTTFLRVSDKKSTIDVVVFRNSVENIDKIKTGDFVEVIGKVEKYKKKLELIAIKIEKFNP
jgi:aspartyl/asparaginyl-tRNA synthetase